MRIWILGASDPEMVAIEQLLAECGEEVVYATVGGARVRPGNAYKADGLSGADPGLEAMALSGADVVIVECGVPTPWLYETNTVVVVDHHHPGDPGFGRGPASFLGAGSVGQVIGRLAREDRLPRAWPHGPGEDASPGQFLLPRGLSGWTVCVEGDGGAGYARHADVPLAIVLAAAGDHCPGHAYRGECPGVDPDALMRWRAETRAAHQRRPAEDVVADVVAATESIRTAPRLGAVVDLRGRDVPELPEAALRLGVAYVAAVAERDGRRKIVLGGADPRQDEIVASFLAGEIVPGLVGLYGDPARGFAGGYLP